MGPIGFGCLSSESFSDGWPITDTEYFIVTPSKPKDCTIISQAKRNFDGRPPECTLIPQGSISYDRWEIIKRPVQKRLNQHLKTSGSKSGKWFTKKETLVARLLGRELCILFWGIKDLPIDMIPNAILNWTKLDTYELLFLFRMSTKDKGWKNSLRYSIGDL